MRGQVLHTYNTTEKIIILHIFIFITLDTKREDKSLNKSYLSFFTNAIVFR